MREVVTRLSLDKLRCRPRESGDLYAVSSPCGMAGETSKNRWLGVPASAGTAAECVAATKFNCSIGAMLLAIAIVSPATAQELRGKDVNLYVGSGAGGPYDAYARLVGRHLGKHLPGNPSVVVQNMPGASGRRLINYMINVAPKDGSAIATIQRGVPFEPLMGEGQFDVGRIAWIGNANNETNVCMAWHASPIRSIEDVRTRTMVVGSSGPASTDSIYPTCSTPSSE